MLEHSVVRVQQNIKQSLKMTFYNFFKYVVVK